jgi:hypothetical protein
MRKRATKQRQKGGKMRTGITVAELLFASILLTGCAPTLGGTPSAGIETPTQQALYDLMTARCDALGKLDLARLKQIYTRESTEPAWLERNVFPVIEQWPAKYVICAVKSFAVVGHDAAAVYSICYRNQYRSDREAVNMLYEKEDGAWRIDAVVVR